jgi:hypothetical protein
MNARDQIAAATRAVDAGFLNAQACGGDSSHEAAVELARRDLLADCPGVPSLAWVADLDWDDRTAFLNELSDALGAAFTFRDFASADRVLSTWWLIAMGERAQESAPGPDIDGSPGDLFDPVDPAGGAS